ncbi:MAG: 3-phosphoshikimate 1-carboxyvinyltransferase [Bacteroidetes bacterium]|nr:3-phosphoshikimate 1-carboxyvinyltransferase [Bacteroidota bacterium]
MKFPKKLVGEVALPSSKSISNRVLIIRELCDEKFEINNLSTADDTQTLKAILESDVSEINAKNAGTAFRFLTAFYAQSNKEITLTGTDRMLHRPVGDLVNALRSIGAEIEYLGEENYPPLKICGKKLKGGGVALSGGLSSQFISALMLIAPTLKAGLQIHLEGEIVSAPYIHLTKNIMQEFGVDVSFENSIIEITAQKYQPKNFTVEADWSAASYWLAMMCLLTDSVIHFPNLKNDSPQGDKILMDLMKDFGLQFTFSKSGCYVKSDGIKLLSFTTNLIHHPDVIPTFVALCCAAKIPFNISGTSTLAYKESPRADALCMELKKLGYKILQTENSLNWDGNYSEVNEEVLMKTHNDHRLAMSWAVLSVVHPSIMIESPEVVQKSYPKFWEDLEKFL